MRGPAAWRSAPADDLRAQLAELAERVAALERIVRRQDAAMKRVVVPVLNVDDRDLLRAILASVGDGVLFSVRELREHQAIDPALARALVGLTPKQLGKRLRALEGHVIGSCVIRAVGRDEHGRIWVLQVVGDLQPDPCGAGEDRRE